MSGAGASGKFLMEWVLLLFRLLSTILKVIDVREILLLWEVCCQVVAFPALGSKLAVTSSEVSVEILIGRTWMKWRNLA
jgi:hypothetical protein